MPEVITAVARDRQLGSLRMAVQSNPHSRWRAGAVLIGIVAAGMTAGGIAISVHGQRDGGHWVYGLPMLVVALLMWAPVPFLWLHTDEPMAWVAWYEHGIVHRRADDQPRAYAWDEIFSVSRHDVKLTNGITSTRLINLQISPNEADGFRVDNDFAGVAEFAEGLTDAFIRVRVPRHFDRLEAGESLRYHPDLAIDMDSLDHDGNRISWAEVERIKIKNGSMAIYRHGEREPWATLSAAAFPNLPVFLTVAEALRHHADT